MSMGQSNTNQYRAHNPDLEDISKSTLNSIQVTLFGDLHEST